MAGSRGGKQKGCVKTGGRVKGSRNKSVVLFEGILLDSRVDLLKEAIKLAKTGKHDAILCKLIDKMLPTLTHNKNDNNDATFESFLKLIKP